MTDEEREVQKALGFKQQYFIQIIESNGVYNIDTTEGLDVEDAVENAERIYAFTSRGYVYGEYWKVQIIED